MSNKFDKHTTAYRFLDRLYLHAAQNPQRQALISERCSMSYVELIRNIKGIIRYFSYHNIDNESVVGINMVDEVDHFIAAIACLSMGCGQIILPNFESPKTHLKTSQLVNLTHIFTDSDICYVSGAVHIPWNEEKRDEVLLDLSNKPIDTGNKDGVLFLKTSGTTGKPNILCFTEELLAHQAKKHPEYLDVRFLRLAPIEFNASKRHRLYCAWMGGTNIFRPSDSLAFISFCLKHRVNCLDISRVHIPDLLANGDKINLQGMQIRPGGGAVPYSLRQRIINEVSPELFVRYATTESGAISMASPIDHDIHESAGRIINGVEVEIVNSDHHTLAPNVSGQIRIRCPGMASGYFNDPEQTEKRFRNGWFYPGDFGYMRKDGQLVVQGRIDEMIIMNGINIFPMEIENILIQHQSVIAAAAIGIPSQVHGQIPVAAIEIRDQADHTIANIKKYCRDHLALRTPRQIIAVSQLPRNAQGKIKKKELVHLFVPRGGEI